MVRNERGVFLTPIAVWKASYIIFNRSRSPVAARDACLGRLKVDQSSPIIRELVVGVHEALGLLNIDIIEACGVGKTQGVEKLIRGVIARSSLARRGKPIQKPKVGTCPKLS